MKESFWTKPPSSSASSSESSSQAERVMVGNSEEELDFLKVFCCLILFLMDCGAGEPISRCRSGI